MPRRTSRRPSTRQRSSGAWTRCQRKAPTRRRSSGAWTRCQRSNSRAAAAASCLRRRQLHARSHSPNNFFFYVLRTIRRICRHLPWKRCRRIGCNMHIPCVHVMYACVCSIIYVRMHLYNIYIYMASTQQGVVKYRRSWGALWALLG